MSTNLCNDQKTFNKAVRNEIEHIDDSDNDNNISKTIVSIIMLVFYIWALLLSMRITDPQHRVLHILLALLTGPLYVLSFYLGMMENAPKIE